MLNLLFLFNIDMILLLIKQSLNNFILNLQIGLVNTVYTIFFCILTRIFLLKCRETFSLQFLAKILRAKKGIRTGRRMGPGGKAMNNLFHFRKKLRKKNPWERKENAIQDRSGGGKPGNAR